MILLDNKTARDIISSNIKSKLHSNLTKLLANKRPCYKFVEQQNVLIAFLNKLSGTNILPITYKKESIAFVLEKYFY